MHIDSFVFGKIIIDGKSYTSDVILYPDRVDSFWWRKEGHYLQKEDLTGILDEKPDILIVGTGEMGVMQVPESSIAFLRKHGVEVHIAMTGKAVELFNARPPDKRVIVAFHLTC